MYALTALDAEIADTMQQDDAWAAAAVFLKLPADKAIPHLPRIKRLGTPKCRDGCIRCSHE